jgi:hypothetical protein
LGCSPLEVEEADWPSELDHEADWLSPPSDGLGEGDSDSPPVGEGEGEGEGDSSPPDDGEGLPCSVVVVAEPDQSVEPPSTSGRLSQFEDEPWWSLSSPLSEDE